MNFDNVTPEQFNEQFMDIIDDPGKIKEASVAGARYVRMKLREEGVMRRFYSEIEPVTTEHRRYQIDPENSDTGYMLMDREPDSRALRLTMRGEPRAEYIMGDKWIIPFQKYASPVWEKNEQELRNIRIPITDIIRNNVVLDMQEEEDKDWLKKCDTACELTGNIYYSTNDKFIKNDLTSLFNMIDKNRLRADTLIMSRPTLNDIYGWEYDSVGSLIETAIEEGIDEVRIGGKRLILTSNTDVLKRGVVYVFTTPEFFGDSFDLGQPTFWMQKDKELIKMSSWYYNGSNIGNIDAVGKMVLKGVEGHEGTE